MVTTAGCGRIGWQGQRASLVRGDAVLIDCNLYQEYATAPGQTWDFHFLHFHALSLDGYREALFAGLTPVRLRSLDAAVERMLQIDAIAQGSGVLSYAKQSHLLSGLITEMILSLSEEETSPSRLNRRDIAALAAFIREHCTEDLHIEDFMAIVRLSRYHLIRLFERQIGLSPYQYLHKCRINLSQNLLRTGSQPIAAVAAAVGYSDPIVFTRHFKDFHGITPAAYRKQSTVYTALRA